MSLVFLTFCALSIVSLPACHLSVFIYKSAFLSIDIFGSVSVCSSVWLVLVPLEKKEKNEKKKDREAVYEEGQD